MASSSSSDPLSPSLRALWARVHLWVWPERYRLVSLPLAALADAARVVAGGAGAFAALVVERDEVSLTVDEARWAGSGLGASREAGPFAAITFDLDLDLDVCGFLAPAAARLAAAGVSIVPQCAFAKDHLLVHDRDRARAVAVLEQLIADCAA
jgi:hypothetical protein